MCTTPFANPLSLCPIPVVAPYPLHTWVIHILHILVSSEVTLLYELGLLRRLVHLGYFIGGLFGWIRDLSLYFPCHSHVFFYFKENK